MRKAWNGHMNTQTYNTSLSGKWGILILCRFGPNRTNIHGLLIFALWNLGALFSTLEQGLEPRLVAGAADVKWHLKVKMNMMFSVWRMCRLPSFWPWVLLHVTQNIVKLRIGKTTCMYAMQQCVCVCCTLSTSSMTEVWMIAHLEQISAKRYNVVID